MTANPGTFPPTPDGEGTWLIQPEDVLVGKWAWRDEATDPKQRQFLRGELVGRVSERFYLIRYCEHPVYGKNTVHELLAVEDLFMEHWAIFESEQHLRAAVEAKQANEQE